MRRSSARRSTWHHVPRGPRFGPAGIREQSLLLRPYNEALESSRSTRSGGRCRRRAREPHRHRRRTRRSSSPPAPAARRRGRGHRPRRGPLGRAAVPPRRRATHGTLSLLQVDAHTDTWDSYFGAKGHQRDDLPARDRGGPGRPERSVQIGLRGPSTPPRTTRTTPRWVSGRCSPATCDARGRRRARARARALHAADLRLARHRRPRPRVRARHRHARGRRPHDARDARAGAGLRGSGRARGR